MKIIRKCVKLVYEKAASVGFCSPAGFWSFLVRWRWSGFMQMRAVEPPTSSCRLIHQLSRSLKAGKQLPSQVMPIRQKTL